MSLRDVEPQAFELLSSAASAYRYIVDFGHEIQGVNSFASSSVSCSSDLTLESNSPPTVHKVHAKIPCCLALEGHVNITFLNGVAGRQVTVRLGMNVPCGVFA